MKIALVSLNPVWEDKKESLRLVQDSLAIATVNGAEYVIFPEMTLTGFSMNSSLLSEDYENSETINEFRRLADYYRVNIIAGVILRKEVGIFNTCFAIKANGTNSITYDKIHPFSFSGEDQYYAKGDKLISLDWEGGWGLTICYDLRFPELYQALSRDNKLLINIASWPKKRVHHWRSLLKARAIENQVFMIGVNRTGIDGNQLEYELSSTIIDPDGLELTPIFCNNNVDIYHIDTNEVVRFREGFPVKNDRREDLYREYLSL